MAWKRFDSSATNGDIQAGDHYKQLRHGQVTRDNFDIISMGIWCRNVYVGGGIVDCSGSGDVDLPWWTPVEIINDGGILTSFVDSLGSAVIKIRFRYRIKMSNAAVNFTPKLWRGSDLDDLSVITTAATISGAAACSAIDDDFSGSNQYQKILATLPGGGIDSLWKAAGTVGGTPASGLYAEVHVWHDLFIEFP